MAVMTQDKIRAADEMIDAIEKKLNNSKELTKDWGKVLLLIFTDINVGYRLRFALDGTCTTEKEEAGKMKQADAEATVSTTVDAMIGIIEGTQSPVLAVMSGKIKIDGSMTALMKLMPAFQ